jgi:hypothetical protein
MGKRTVAERVVAGLAVALGAVALGAGTAGAASPACTDTLTGTGGWFDASSWSAGHVPRATDAVCIPGPARLGLGNDTVTVADLTLGAGAELDIGSGGPGDDDVTITGTLTNDGTLSAGWAGSLTAGKLINHGTLLDPFTGFEDHFTFGGVVNTGSFVAADRAVVTLRDHGRFDNAGGIIATMVTQGPQPILGTLLITSPTSGTGTLELGPGSAVAMARPGTFMVDDAVDMSGGAVCGGPLLIGAIDGGAGGVAFPQAPAPASAPVSGCPDGSTPSQEAVIASVSGSLGGTIPAGYTVAVDGSGSIPATVTLAGRVVNQGTLQLGSGTTVLGHDTADTLVNEGELRATHTALDTGLENDGSLRVTSVTASLTTGEAWRNGTDGHDGSIVGSLVLTSPPHRSATFIQDGTLNGSVAVEDPVEIAGGSICGAGLTFEQPGGLGAAAEALAFDPDPDPGVACPAGEAAGQITDDNAPLSVTGDLPHGDALTLVDDSVSGVHGDAELLAPGPFANDGTLTAEDGALISVDGTFTNRGTLTVSFFGDDLPVDLETPQLINLGKVSLVAAGLDVSGSLENAAKLALAGPGAVVDVGGGFTQDAGGVLRVGLPGLSQVAVGGGATLGGSLRVAPDVPKGTAVPIVSDHGTQGTFATVKGPYDVAYGDTGVSATRRPRHGSG